MRWTADEFQEFKTALATGGLAALGIEPHVLQMLQDVHNGTWLSVEGVPEVIETSHGTKIGNPLGDILFGTTMTKVLRSLRRRMSDAGVLTEVPWDGTSNFLTPTAPPQI